MQLGAEAAAFRIIKASCSLAEKLRQFQAGTEAAAATLEDDTPLISFPEGFARNLQRGEGAELSRRGERVF